MPDLIPIHEEIAELVHSVTRQIRAASRAELDPLGLTPAQARALRVIDRADAPIRMSALADHLRIARRSATSVVDERAERDLVERRNDPVDRRAVEVLITTNGREMLAAMNRVRRVATAELLAALPEPDLIHLRDLLRRLDPGPAPVRTTNPGH